MTPEKNKQMNDLVTAIIRTAKLKEFGKLPILQTKLSYVLSGKKGADVDATDENGQKAGAFVALISAMNSVQDSRIPTALAPTVKMMVKYGADVHTPINGTGLNVVEYAYTKVPEAVELLVKSPTFDSAKVKNMDGALLKRNEDYHGQGAEIQKAAKILMENGVKREASLMEERRLGAPLKTLDVIATEMLKADPHNETVMRYAKIRKKDFLKQRNKAAKGVRKFRKIATAALGGKTDKVVRKEMLESFIKAKESISSSRIKNFIEYINKSTLLIEYRKNWAKARAVSMKHHAKTPMPQTAVPSVKMFLDLLEARRQRQ